MLCYLAVMNVTLSVDEKVIRRARKVAQAMGKSLNQLVRDYLSSLATAGDVEAEIDELRRLSKTSGGRSRGRRLDRQELHERA